MRGLERCGAAPEGDGPLSEELRAALALARRIFDGVAAAFAAAEKRQAEEEARRAALVEHREERHGPPAAAGEEDEDEALTRRYFEDHRRGFADILRQQKSIEDGYSDDEAPPPPSDGAEGVEGAEWTITFSDDAVACFATAYARIFRRPAAAAAAGRAAQAEEARLRSRLRRVTATVLAALQPLLEAQDGLAPLLCATDVACRGGAAASGALLEVLRLTGAGGGAGGAAGAAAERAAGPLDFVLRNGEGLSRGEAPFDFHRDACPGELARLDVPVVAVQRKAQELLSISPGNALLITVARIAGRLRRTAFHRPLPAALAGVELLLQRAEEWNEQSAGGSAKGGGAAAPAGEESAASRYGFAAVALPLRRLVARWRRMELQSWRDLAVVREAQLAGRNQRHWLRLYRITQGLVASSAACAPLPPSPAWLWGSAPAAPAPAEAEAGLAELFPVVEEFLGACSILEFPQRLHAVQSLAAELLQAPAAGGGAQRAARMLLGLWRYYCQFAPAVCAAAARRTRGVHKELADQAKLGSWDEQRHYMMQDQSRRSQRTLARLLKAHDDCLHAPLSEVLAKALTDGVALDMSASAEENAAAARAVPLPSQTFPHLAPLGDAPPPPREAEAPAAPRPWDAAGFWPAPSELPAAALAAQPPSKVPARMRSLLGGGRYGVDAALAGEMEWACDAVFSRMAALRAPKVAKAAKRLALKELVKYLGSQGLSRFGPPAASGLRAALLRPEAPLEPEPPLPPAATLSLGVEAANRAADAASAPSALRELLGDGAAVLCAKAEAYYVRCAAELSQLRGEASSAAAPELTRSERDGASGMAAHLFAAQMRARALLQRSVSGAGAASAALREAIRLHAALSAPATAAACPAACWAAREAAAEVSASRPTPSRPRPRGRREPLPDAMATLAHLASTAGPRAEAERALDTVSAALDAVARRRSVVADAVADAARRVAAARGSALPRRRRPRRAPRPRRRRRSRAPCARPWSPCSGSSRCAPPSRRRRPRGRTARRRSSRGRSRSTGASRPSTCSASPPPPTPRSAPPPSAAARRPPSRSACPCSARWSTTGGCRRPATRRPRRASGSCRTWCCACCACCWRAGSARRTGRRRRARRARAARRGSRTTWRARAWARATGRRT